MEEIEIKQEYDGAQCPTCLSVGRKLIAIGKYSDIMKKFIQDVNCPIYTEYIDICWECHAVLQKVLKFQNNVIKAYEMLKIGQSYLNSLSSLTSVTINDTNETDTKHKEIHYEDDDQQDIEPIVDVKVKKNSNKWAQKRALQNKKPKFKVINIDKVNVNDVFVKYSLSNEEMLKEIEIARNNIDYKSKRFKCEKCVVGFNKENMLVVHNKKCHVKTLGKYTCDICKTRIKDKRHLSAHISKHYIKYRCRVCSYTCSKTHTHKHMRTHRKVFVCVKCGLMFSGRRDFFKHYKEWHELFICDYCGISFKMRYCIKDHIRRQHSPWCCPMCPKQFPRYNALWLHKQVHHSAPTPAYCVECDKKYPTMIRYKWHLANSVRHKAREKQRIPCPACDKVFTKNIYMKDHYHLVHLKNYKYRCEECDKNFIRNADLVKHKRRVHEGILPPKNKICYVCGRGFTTNKILTNHLRTHSGERPFVCSQCPAKFAQNAALTAHTRALHHTGA